MIILEGNKKNILSVGKKLRQGYVIVYPTDTAYALGGVFDNPRVIRRILKIKKRRDNKFTLIASSAYQAEKFFFLSRPMRRAAKKYWPGPLSLVVSKKYAVRVPKNALARKLARLAQKPLIATSANISGKKTPYSLQEILRQHSGRKNRELPDIILNAGKLKKLPPSAVVKIGKNGSIRVLRAGAFVIKENTA